MTLNFEDNFWDLLDYFGDPIDNFGDNLESRKKSDNVGTRPVVVYETYK